ncbi:hypothetical protein [Sideroxydans lithotrophicus]|uniref:Uncharacterized protein n=1 Tax=Sideroxydans lithotrophicus (strain ES-1) TaxID=580332 RepID=D5CPJ1_SIDLE|nr:hypothetical protein [Sideroxydans lithotrophicus]ADE12986.1 hypothetical protein Slit_2761 [Sideroxydans lithotrophicus ES-1]
MNLQPTFRIHLADPLGLADAPFIVTTAYTQAAGLAHAEWFLVVPEGKGMLFAQRNTLDSKSFPDAHVKLDEELLLNEVLDQAKLRLRRYILENKGDAAPLLLAKQIELQHTDHNHLARLWMRGSYCGCLSEIRAKSRCTALIDTLVWIHGLPMLAAEDL